MGKYVKIAPAMDIGWGATFYKWSHPRVFATMQEGLMSPRMLPLQLIKCPFKCFYDVLKESVTTFLDA